MGIRVIGPYVVIVPGGKQDKKSLGDGAFPALNLNFSNNYGQVIYSNLQIIPVGSKVYYTNSAMMGILIEGKECIVAKEDDIIAIVEE